MHRIDGDGHVGNRFEDWDPSVPGAQGTVQTAAWTNAVQEELVNAIEGSGQTLAKPDNTQLRKAIHGGPWTALPLNTAGNWAALGGGTSVAPQYRLDGSGRCWLRGEVFRSSGTAATLATLPAGFIPPEVRGQSFVIASDHASGSTSVRVAGVDASGLANPGDVYILANDAASLDLSGIVFYVDGR